MTNKQKTESCTVQDPIIIDFEDDDLVSMGETQWEEAAKTKIGKYITNVETDFTVKSSNLLIAIGGLADGGFINLYLILSEKLHPSKKSKVVIGHCSVCDKPIFEDQPRTEVHSPVFKLFCPNGCFRRAKT